MPSSLHDIGTTLATDGESPFLMQCPAPATGIAMCRIVVAVEEQIESAVG